jgi:DNA polymerase
VPPATDDVIAALDALRQEVECCSSCVLAETRTRAVFGEGDPGADLMFVGEAPGYHEDQQGRPFVGQAGKLLEQLLASVGMTREQVYIANVLKSRPPNNRDPRPEEIDACRPYLWRQIEIIRPKVICTLGNFATKLLSGDQRGITKVHGQPRATEIAGHRLYLYPIFHPAAALYTPANLATLKQDFLRLPELLAQAAPQPGQDTAPSPAAERPAWRPPEACHGCS